MPHRTKLCPSFAQYFVDSYFVHRQRALRGSRLGRYNGILYFVPLCLDILVRLGFNFLQPVLTLLVWLLVVSTLVSMGQRLVSTRRAPELPAAETARAGCAPRCW